MIMEKKTMARYQANDHTFAICAYKESPYLEECIKSLLAQKEKSNVIMVTSTPCDYISNMAHKYGVELYINTGEGGIARDWNFAYQCAHTKLVTIAHQDDIYTEEYLQTILAGLNYQEKPLIAFTNYGEMRDGQRVNKNRLLNIKRIMLFPLQSAKLQRSRFVRRRILSMGSAICCPSVTLVKDFLPKMIFEPGYRSNVDWQAWERISKLQGAFVYCKDILMYHRIHKDSATTEIIADNDRSKEDLDMLCRFWPEPIARIIEYFYSKGEKSNDL